MPPSHFRANANASVTVNAYANATGNADANFHVAHTFHANVM
jgi:hypothetical protein